MAKGEQKFIGFNLRAQRFVYLCLKSPAGFHPPAA